MNVSSFPYKCPYCQRTGRYKTNFHEVATEFKCPYDGSRLIWQSPLLFKAPTVSERLEILEATKFEDYTPSLPARIMNKITAAVSRL